MMRKFNESDYENVNGGMWMCKIGDNSNNYVLEVEGAKELEQLENLITAIVVNTSSFRKYKSQLDNVIYNKVLQEKTGKDQPFSVVLTPEQKELFEEAAKERGIGLGFQADILRSYPTRNFMTL